MQPNLEGETEGPLEKLSCVKTAWNSVGTALVNENEISAVLNQRKGRKPSRLVYNLLVLRLQKLGGGTMLDNKWLYIM